MIAECPDCGKEKHVTRDNEEDIEYYVCSVCGTRYRVSLVRMEAAEVNHVDENC